MDLYCCYKVYCCFSTVLKQKCLVKQTRWRNVLCQSKNCYKIVNVKVITYSFLHLCYCFKSETLYLNTTLADNCKFLKRKKSMDLKLQNQVAGTTYKGKYNR